MRRFLPIFLGLLLVGAAASAQDTRRQESRKAQLEKEIAAINRQLKDNARSSSRALTDLSLVRRKIAARQELIAESDREIRALDDSMKVRQQEIDRLQARHDTLSLYYNRLVRGAYKNRDSRLWYMYILSSENIGQAVRRFGYLKGLSRNMSDQAKHIQETAAALELEKDRLAGLREEAQVLRGQRQADVDALRSEEGESASLVARLEKDRRKYQNDLKKKNREVEALQGREDHLHRHRRNPVQELRRQQGPPALAGRGHRHRILRPALPSGIQERQAPVQQRRHPRRRPRRPGQGRL